MTDSTEVNGRAKVCERSLAPSNSPGQEAGRHSESANRDFLCDLPNRLVLANRESANFRRQIMCRQIVSWQIALRQIATHPKKIDLHKFENGAVVRAANNVKIISPKLVYNLVKN